MEPNPPSQTKRWAIAHWILFSLSLVVAGGLNMFHIRGGFFTNYLADLTTPAYLYVVFRRLWTDKEVKRKTPFFTWLGATAERSAAFLFLASTGAEVSSYYWPSGPFPGTFDPFDILAYGTGLAICYIADRRTNRDKSIKPEHSTTAE